MGRAENSKSGKCMWICICDCGREKQKPVTGYSLKKGEVTSCGCYRKEVTRDLGKKQKSHGMTGTRIWNTWKGMKRRCRKHPLYKGISVCQEWEDFHAFYKWALENGYDDSVTLDRIDNNGNYEPTNCRWATYKQQENNRRNNKIVMYKGEEKTLSQVADDLGLSSATLANRIKCGWPETEWCLPANLNNKNIRRGKYA